MTGEKRSGSYRTTKNPMMLTTASKISALADLRFGRTDSIDLLGEDDLYE
jgi:hypothetical protein